MKKILSLLASIGLVATASTAAVSCGTIKSDSGSSAQSDQPTITSCSFSDNGFITLEGSNLGKLKLTNKNFIVELFDGKNISNLIIAGEPGVSDSSINLFIQNMPSYKVGQSTLTIYYNLTGDATKNSSKFIKNL